MTAHVSAAAHLGKAATTATKTAAAKKSTGHVATSFADALSKVQSSNTGSGAYAKSVKAAFASQKA
jgi:hypothetical protein